MAASRHWRVSEREGAANRSTHHDEDHWDSDARRRMVDVGGRGAAAPATQPAKEPTLHPGNKALTLDLDNKVTINLVQIPAGKQSG